MNALTSPTLLLFTKPADDDAVARLIDELLGRKRDGRIRCPLCAWQPTKDSRWWCEPKCGHTWNTFDTGGKCPACSKQWVHTACLSCSGWTRHVDWYVAKNDERA